MIKLVSTGVFLSGFALKAVAYIDEYNSYNNAYNSNSYSAPSGNTSPGNASQNIQAALSVFQDVDCQHMGCDTKKQDFLDDSGDMPKQQTFQIQPSQSDNNFGGN